MTGKITHLVKHRPVIDRTKGKDISQEPEMKKLVEIDRTMTPDERSRIIKHLEDNAKKEVAVMEKAAKEVGHVQL